jgi:hypothetical protein
MMNLPIRSLRLAEEAVELAQANGIPREKMVDLVNMVYRKPPGELKQELGGVLLCAAVYSLSSGWDPEDVFKIELERCLSLPEEKFAKRNQEKIDLGMTI